MAQVTIYIKDALVRAIKRRSEERGTSVSAYLAELAARDLARPTRWPDGFADLYGSWQGDFETPDDPPPDEEDSL